MSSIETYILPGFQSDVGNVACSGRDGGELVERGQGVGREVHQVET